MDKRAAEELVKQIQAYRAECNRLAQLGLAPTSAQTGVAISKSQDQLIKKLEEEYFIDVTQEQTQLRLGIKIASALASVALCLAVFFFFYRFWGYLDTGLQVAILIVAPCLSIFGTDLLSRKDNSGYFAAILGLVSFALAVLNLVALAQIFNLHPSHQAFLIWGALGLLLAYAYGFRLLLYAGLISLLGFTAAEVGTWGGCYWLSVVERPENFLFAGGLILAGMKLPIPRRNSNFVVAYKVVGLLAVFFSVLVLANWGEGSYLLWDNRSIENCYQVLGFLVWGGLIALGLKLRDNYFVNMGVTFFTIQLYTRIFDWFWDWMPKYLFFLLVALMFIFFLVVMIRLRKFQKQKVETA